MSEPAIVPLLVGLSASAAEELLVSRGLVVERSPADAPDDAVVVDQSLRPGGGQVGDRVVIIFER